MKWGLSEFLTSLFFILIFLTSNLVISPSQQRAAEASTAPFLSTDNTSTDFLTYQNSNYGIKIKYPADWKKIEYDSHWDHGPLSFGTLSAVTFFLMNQSDPHIRLAEVTINVDFLSDFNIIGLEDPTSGIIQERINRYNESIKDSTIGNFIIQGLNSNISVAGNQAYKLDYTIFSYGLRDCPCTHVTEIFAINSNKLYQFMLEVQCSQDRLLYECRQDRLLYDKIFQKMIESFEISYERTDFPTQITIDGKVGKQEWNNRGLFNQKTFNLTLANNTDLLPYTYNVTLYGTGDDENVYLLAEIKGPPDFRGGVGITYFLDNYDSLVMHKDLLLIDGFVSEDTTQEDEYFRGTTNGQAAGSFSNGTEIFEVSHPLCSKDRYDMCIDPDKRIDLTFRLWTSDDFNIEQLVFSVGSGFRLFTRTEAYAIFTDVVSPANFVLEALARSSVQERTEYLKAFTEEERREFLKDPTSDEIMKLIRGLTYDKLLNFFRGLTLDEGKKLSDIISENEREEILNKFSDPMVREEISKKLTSST